MDRTKPHSEQTVKVDLSRVESLADEIEGSVDWALRVCLPAGAEPGIVVLTEAIEEAALALHQCNAVRKVCEAKRKEWVKPLNDHVKAYNAAVKTKLAPLVAAEQSLKDLTLAWGRTVRSIEAEAEKERQAAIRAEEARVRKIEQDRLAEEERCRIANLPPPEPKPDPEPEPAKPIAPYVMPVKTAMRTRLDWTFDVELGSEVPREYLCVDLAQIKYAVGQGIREIPGVKIYQKEIPITAG